MQEILQKYTARQLRLAFLTQLWNSKVDFSESLMTGEVRGIEIAFNVRLCSFPLPSALFRCVCYYLGVRRASCHLVARSAVTLHVHMHRLRSPVDVRH